MRRPIIIASCVGICFLIGFLVMKEPKKTLPGAVEAAKNRDRLEIRQLIQSLEESATVSEELTFLKGVDCVLAKQPGRALDYFGQIEPEGELRQQVLQFTGESLWAIGQIGDAEFCFRQIIQEEPENIEANRWLAVIDYDTGNINSALDRLHLLTEKLPDDFRPYALIGEIYKDFDKPEAAADAYRQASELAEGPTQQILRSQLARVLIRSGKFESALAAVKDETAPEAICLRAECLWNLGNAAGATELLLSLNELSIEGKLTLARIRFDEGHAQEVIDLLVPTVDQHQDSEECHFLIANAYQLLGNQEQHELFAERTEEIKSLKTTLTELSSKAMDSPDDADVRDQLAATYQKLGMEHLAQVWSRAAHICRTRVSQP